MESAPPLLYERMQRPKFAWTKFDDDQLITLDRNYIRNRTMWIRDELDPRIARDGPDFLSPDNVITLFTFLDDLCRADISTQTLRCSRVHMALLEISGRATRWPAGLIDKVDSLIQYWEVIHGPLILIRPLLYESGGRLHGICTPEDIERERLLIKWLRTPGTPVSPAIARRHGDLGFRPGDWWINAMFAYRAGIIDNGNPAGGIICDDNDAYALLMTHFDEIASSTPKSFTYRSRSTDPGRYRLTSATVSSRQPIRVLRSHTLRSFWTPRAGIRYEGLFKVTGWSITFDPKTRQNNYDITFTRIEDQAPMTEVMTRPSAEDVDDYREYKRIRREVRAARNPLTRARPLNQPLSAGLDPLHTRRQSQILSEQLHLLHQNKSHHSNRSHGHVEDRHASPPSSPVKSGAISVIIPHLSPLLSPQISPRMSPLSPHSLSPPMADFLQPLSLDDHTQGTEVETERLSVDLLEPEDLVLTLDVEDVDISKTLAELSV